MTPDRFPERNKTLNPPQGMADCDPLEVWSDGRVCISRWKMTPRERLNALLWGRVWLRVYFGSTQPPVSLEICRTIFIEPAPKAWWQRARDFISAAKRRMLSAAR